MHSLEYMILQLAVRIEKETGNKALADDAKELASASHSAFGESDDQGFRELWERWHKLHGHLLTGD